MAGRWRITSHPRGEWIIQAGRARCAVGAELGRALLPLDGQAPGLQEIQRQLESRPAGDFDPRETSQRLAGILGASEPRPGRPESRPARRAMWLRVPLIPAWLVEKLARRLEALTWWPSLLAMAVIGGGMYLVGALRSGWIDVGSGGHLGPGLGVFLALALWHELGHAAALQREGYPPGGIGLGVLFVVPVLFADVSAVAALPRVGRLRVDLAGVCFQLGAGGWLFAAGALNPHLQFSGALRLGGLLALPAVAWSLLPFIRADGYWFLADLLGLSDLERPVPLTSGRRLKLFLILHRVLNGAFLLMVGVAIPLRVHRWLAWLFTGWGMPDWLAPAVTAGFALAAWWQLVARLLLLWSANRVDLGRLLSE